MLYLSLCESLCVCMDQNFAMSVSPQEFEDAKRDYVSTIPDVDLLRNQLRELNKKQKKRKDVIFKYMCENELEGITVAGISFERTRKTSLKLTEDLLEDLVSDAAQLEQIRADHSVSKEIFKVKKQKKNHDANTD